MVIYTIIRSLSEIEQKDSRKCWCWIFTVSVLAWDNALFACKFFSWVAICSSKLAISLILLFGGLEIAGFCLFEFLLSDFQIGYN
jgi:hypothetical protein